MALSSPSSSERLELDRLRQRILRGIDPLLHAVGIDAHEVSCDVDGDVDHVEVTLRAPVAARPVQQAMGVRVVDAIRGADQTLGPVHVDYRFGPRP